VVVVVKKKENMSKIEIQIMNYCQLTLIFAFGAFDKLFRFIVLVLEGRFAANQTFWILIIVVRRRFTAGGCVRVLHKRTKEKLSEIKFHSAKTQM